MSRQNARILAIIFWTSLTMPRNCAGKHRLCSPTRKAANGTSCPLGLAGSEPAILGFAAISRTLEGRSSSSVAREKPFARPRGNDLQVFKKPIFLAEKWVGGYNGVHAFGFCRSPEADLD
jgi:hypothetical protein